MSKGPQLICDALYILFNSAKYSVLRFAVMLQNTLFLLLMLIV